MRTVRRTSRTACLRRPEFGGDQRRRCADEPRSGPQQKAEDRDAERRGGERRVAEPCDEDHVDRVDQHLQQVRRRQRHGKRQRRTEFLAETLRCFRGQRGRLLQHSRPG
jgi:hypothetical protein